MPSCWLNQLQYCAASNHVIDICGQSSVKFFDFKSDPERVGFLCPEASAIFLMPGFASRNSWNCSTVISLVAIANDLGISCRCSDSIGDLSLPGSLPGEPIVKVTGPRMIESVCPLGVTYQFLSPGGSPASKLSMVRSTDPCSQANARSSRPCRLYRSSQSTEE